MKYFVVLLLVALAHCDDDYVRKNRKDVAETFRKCLAAQGTTKETFEKTDWTVDSEDPFVQTTIKCVVTDFGVFDETTGFNKDRMVKQFGGEALRERVEKCIDKYPVGVPTMGHSVQSVMTCLEEDNLKMYPVEAKN